MNKKNKKQTMGDVKIALNMILKYDEPVKIVKRALDTVLPYVDDAFITVTYSEKKPKDSKLVKYLEKQGVNVSFFEWVNDFSAARNFNLEQVPDDYYWIFWMDADDVLKGGENLKDIAKTAYLRGVASVFFNYWYRVDLDDEGNVREVIIEHKRERIFRNDGTYKWIGRLHETLIPQREENIKQIYLDDCVVIHLTDHSREETNMERNREILESALEKEDSKDPRTRIYLAKVYFDMAKDELGEEDNDEARELIERAKDLFYEYLNGKGKPGTSDFREPSGWAQERATAWGYLGEIYKMEKKYNSSLKALYNAITEDPLRPRYYLDIAMCWVVKEEWDKAEQWLKMGMNTPVPEETTMILNPRDLKAQSLEIAYHTSIAKQKLDVAEEVSTKLVGLFPDKDPLKERLQMVKNLKATNKAAQCVVYLARYLEAAKEYAKIPWLLKSVPSQLTQERFISEMQNKYLPPRKWEDNEVAIVCGPGFEKWSPKSLKTGLGGSETAVIRLAKELTDLGYKVTVYGDPQDDAGNYDGVEFKQWHEINPRDKFNILVVWRAVGFLDSDLKAKATYLWLHDVPNNAEFTEERIEKLDRIIVLSDFHKSLCRMNKDGKFIEIPEDIFFVTNNGIAEPVMKDVPRDPKRMVWGSSYDRGIIYLLNIWSDVIKEVPNAKLNIYYGWTLFDKLHGDNPARMAWKAKVQEKMDQKGITHHGRVGKEELWTAHMQSGIWAYPTDFEEINCITAQEAQAYGAIPVCTDYAALKETVRHGIKVPVDITTDEGQKKYKEELIGLLKDVDRQEEIRKPMMEEAREVFLWSETAKDWDEEFQEMLEEKKKEGVNVLEGGGK